MASILEVLSKFEGGQELCQTSALFNRCVHCLAAGMDVYLLLEEVVKASEGQRKCMEEIIQKSSIPVTFLYEKEG